MPRKRIEIQFKANEGPSKATVIMEFPSYNVPSAPRVKLRRPYIRPVITPAVIEPKIETQPIPAIIEVPYGPEQIIERVVPVNYIPEEYDPGITTSESNPFLRSTQAP